MYGLPLPKNIPPTTATACWQILIPNDPDYIMLLAGAVGSLALWNSYEKSVGHQGTQVAAIWRQALATLTPCDLATVEYRIDPIDPCIIQVSTDGGATWATFYDPRPCFPTPDLSHFLVDNPSVVGQENIIHAPTGLAGVFVYGSDTGAFWAEQGNGRALLLQRPFGNTTAQPVVDLQIHSAGGGSFLKLFTPSDGYFDVINEHGMYMAPSLSAPPTADPSLIGGVYLAGSHFEKAYMIIPDSLGFVQARPLWFEHDFLNTQTLLPIGAQPRILFTVGATDITADLGAPPIDPPTLFHQSNTALTAGNPPVLTAITSIAGDGSRGVTYDLAMPPIPLPNFDHTTNTENGNILHPVLSVVTSTDGTKTDTTFDLLYPPAVAAFTLPVSGVKHYTMTIEAYGTMFPLLVPSGAVFSNFRARGLWIWQDHLSTPNVVVYNGQARVPGSSSPGDLEAQIAPANAVPNTAQPIGSGFSPFDGWTMSADGFIFFSGVFGTILGAQTDYVRGQLTVDFDIAITSPYAWTIDLDLTAATLPSNFSFQGSGGTVAHTPGRGVGGEPIQNVDMFLNATIADVTTTFKRAALYWSLFNSDTTTNDFRTRVGVKGTYSGVPDHNPAPTSGVDEFDLIVVPGAGPLGSSQPLWQFSYNSSGGSGTPPTNAYATRVVWRGDGTPPSFI